MSIDIRRHATRASAADDIGGLSAAGIAMARRLRSPDRFALVLSSPADRCTTTAMEIADRVDEVDPILGAAPDEALTQAQYDGLRSQDAVADLLRLSVPARRFAEEQLALWQSLARRVGDGVSVLLVTHGGNIELPGVLLAAALGASLDPLPLGYCEGVRVRIEAGRPVDIERIRA